MDKERYLITTADERTWKFDRPVLFLTDNCCRYARKNIWSNMDAVVSKPYGVLAAQKNDDLAYIHTVVNQLLIELVEQLNKHHGTNHSSRYWSIVLGHWLLNYVKVAYNRYRTVQQALKIYSINGTMVIDANCYDLTTRDLSEFLGACNDSAWNNVFYSKIIYFLDGSNIECYAGSLGDEVRFSMKNTDFPSWKSNLKNYALNRLGKFFSMFGKEDDVFIINTYMPILYEIKLYLSLGQSPKFWRRQQLDIKEKDSIVRKKFSLNTESHLGFECFARSILPEVIPTCYLEGYNKLVEQVESLPWPSSPKFIFTSNNFYSDELFKVWAGSKVESGTPYYVGQHGNCQAYRGHSFWPEYHNSDKFFSWGWTSNNHRIVPAFIFKTLGRKNKKIDHKGGILLIELHSPSWSSPEDSEYEYGIYQDEQFNFVDALPENIQKELTVRLHSAHYNYHWSDEKRWLDRHPQVKIEIGAMSIEKLISRSRLIVHSYDSTGILETLALNIPTMCFWQGGLDHLLPDAKPYYELLRSAKILVDTPEQAAEMIAMHWDNISKWWESEKVQNARTVFCEQYARLDDEPIKTLRKLLVEG